MSKSISEQLKEQGLYITDIVRITIGDSNITKDITHWVDEEQKQLIIDRLNGKCDTR